MSNPIIVAKVATKEEELSVASYPDHCVVSLARLDLRSRRLVASCAACGREAVSALLQACKLALAGTPHAEAKPQTV